MSSEEAIKLWRFTPQTNKLLGHPEMSIIQREPWNPNVLEDSVYGSTFPYREDQKVRAIIGTPSGELHILFWDYQQMDDLLAKSTYEKPWGSFETFRSWGYDLIRIQPKNVVYLKVPTDAPS